MLALLVSSCGSLKVKSLKNQKTLKLKYNVFYPSYSGQTKEYAKAKRKEFLNRALQNIYESVSRLGRYGPAQYAKNDFKRLKGIKVLYPGFVPFTSTRGHVFNYTPNHPYHDYGCLSERAVSCEPGYVRSTPMAETPEDEYIISPKELRRVIDKNIIVLTRNQYSKDLRKFHENHNLFNSKKIFKELFYTKKFFSKTVSEKYGMAISRETVNLKNTINYSIGSETARQQIWALAFILNSKVDAKRINKKQLSITISVPIDKIMKKYQVLPLRKFIEE